MRVKKRFVVYADILGTMERYKNPELVVRGRELLEQALAQIVVPKLSKNDMYIYIFSDTAIITCTHMDKLLDCISRLFAHFIDLMEDKDDEILRLWLRAGISHGIVLTVDHLQNSDRVRTLPFLDPSLPKAYKLESIRKGSRIFIDPAISDKEFEKHKGRLIRWRQITGHGGPVENAGECLWPAIAYGENQLIEATYTLYQRWLIPLEKRTWSRDDYINSVLYHVDETLKLFIRSVCLSSPRQKKNSLLKSFLPSSSAKQTNIRFKWGFWFQVLKGLAEDLDSSTTESEEFIRVFKTVEEVIRLGGFLRHFTKELDCIDYARFRDILFGLGLVSQRYNDEQR
jgi:hypothetical protein